MFGTYSLKSLLVLSVFLSGCSLSVDLAPGSSNSSPETSPTDPVQQAQGKVCFDGVIRTVLESGGVRYYGGDFSKAGPCGSGIVRMDSDDRNQPVILPVSAKEIHALAQDSTGRYYVVMTPEALGEMTLKRFSAKWELDSSFQAPTFYYPTSLLESKLPFAWLKINQSSVVLAGTFTYSKSEEEVGGGEMLLALEDAQNVAILNKESGALLPASSVGEGLDLRRVDDVVFVGNRVVLAGNSSEHGSVVVDVDYVDQSVFIDLTGFEDRVTLLQDGSGQALLYNMGSESSELYSVAGGNLIPRAFDISACGVMGSPTVKASGDTLYLLALVDFEAGGVNFCSYNLSTNQITKVQAWDVGRLPPSGRFLWGVSEDHVVLSLGDRFAEFKRSDLSETYFQEKLEVSAFASVEGGFFALGTSDGVAGTGASAGIYAQSISTGAEVDLSVALQLSDENADGVSVRGLAVHNNKLYVGGIFDEVNGEQREGLVILDIEDDYSPVALPLPVSGQISGMSLYGNKLYMAGYGLVVGEPGEEEVGELGAMSVDGASKLVALDLNTGLLDGGLSNQIYADIGDADVYSLLVNQSGIFIGGYFEIGVEDDWYWDFVVLDHSGAVIGTPLPAEPGNYERVTGIVELNGKVYFGVGDYTTDKATYAELKSDMTFETRLFSDVADSKIESLFVYDGKLHGVLKEDELPVVHRINDDGSFAESDKISVGGLPANVPM